MNPYDAFLTARLADGVQSFRGSLLYVQADGLLTTDPTGGVLVGVQESVAPFVDRLGVAGAPIEGCVQLRVRCSGVTLQRAANVAAPSDDAKIADILPLILGERPADPELW